MKRLVLVCALLATALIRPAAAAVVAPVIGPANDAFADAMPIGGLPFTDAQDVTFATEEIGEPLCGSTPGHTLWYSYTPATDVVVRIEGASYGIVGVYRGTRVNELNQIACMPGYPIDVPLAGGKTYRFQLDGGATGTAGFLLREMGTIAGRVLDPGGAPAHGVCVSASPVGEDGISVASTEPDGTYRIDALEPGSYDVSFGCDSGPYGTIWYDGALTRDDATPVAVGAGAVVAGIDGRLPVPTVISGRVTASSGDAVSFCVTAHRPGGVRAAFAAANAAGRYRLYVSPGDYAIRFEACGGAAIAEWYDDAPDEASAQLVTAIFGQETAGIDAELIAVTSAPNDAIGAAEPVGPFPYRTYSFAGATIPRPFESEPQQCESDTNGWTGSVWYRFEPAVTTTVVVAPEGRPNEPAVLDAYVAGESGLQSSLVKVSCTNASAGVRRLAFVAEAGRTYYVQHGSYTFQHDRSPVALVFDETAGGSSATLDIPVPCAAACYASLFSTSCAPGPVPESYRDVPITVPASVEGIAPADLAVDVRMTGDVDSMLCRDDDGSLTQVAGGDRGRSQDCTLVYLGCEETYAVPVSPGDRLVLRVFDYADPGTVEVAVSYRRDR